MNTKRSRGQGFHSAAFGRNQIPRPEPQGNSNPQISKPKRLGERSSLVAKLLLRDAVPQAPACS